MPWERKKARYEMFLPFFLFASLCPLPFIMCPSHTDSPNVILDSHTNEMEQFLNSLSNYASPKLSKCLINSLKMDAYLFRIKIALREQF